MDLVLADIARWRTQLKGELVKVEQALEGFDERVKEERERLETTKEVAEKKIAEAEELLEAHEFVEEVVVEATSDEAEVPLAADG